MLLWGTIPGSLGGRLSGRIVPRARQVQAGLIPETLPHSLPVHPTQLYAAFDGFLILALLTIYFPFRRRDGEVMALLMFLYPLTRFFEEALRNDEPGSCSA